MSLSWSAIGSVGTFSQHTSYIYTYEYITKTMRASGDQHCCFGARSRYKTVCVKIFRPPPGYECLGGFLYSFKTDTSYVAAASSSYDFSKGLRNVPTRKE